MKAVAYQNPGPIDREDALQDVTLEKPVVTGRDLLVEVRAVSVNPVDAKVRQRLGAEDGGWKVLGYDAAGVVSAVGPQVEGFQVGDEVYYAGSIARPGTNAEFHLVDERIVGRKPANLSFAEAAALPLTAITAWEMLFDRLDVRRPTPEGGDLILVIGGAGGVGSITLQLLAALTDLTIVATASRPETKAWVQECGAHHVLDHREPLAAQFAALSPLGQPGFVFATTQTDRHWEAIAELIAPQGRVGLIDDPAEIDLKVMKRKALSIHWEFMFARPVFATADQARQGQLLNELATLVDAGKVRSTLTEVAGPITAANLRAQHARIESGTARGKIVLEGFGG
ncbi:zinc-binding alcohol dehydrogenase family protein [Roseibacillus ishigakijimensis]|uniref:Zinc-type alcohol dehydrogenase-like protein n=1 Tax=Roseibacillus ishigakijimensis TaxID=454146 RepID=A0A934VLI5_9BACT|nr:zinc-binding alcohol dehydrogenase family protein [Roseibacillus ishigakijimensis]